jgi:hypothetical protein
VLSSLRQPVFAVHRSASIQVQDDDDDPGRVAFRWIGPSGNQQKGNNRARVTCGASPCPGVRLRFALPALSESTHYLGVVATATTAGCCCLLCCDVVMMVDSGVLPWRPGVCSRLAPGYWWS